MVRIKMNLKENCLSHAKNFSFSSAHGNSVLTLQTQKTQNQILIEQQQHIKRSRVNQAKLWSINHKGSKFLKTHMHQTIIIIKNRTSGILQTAPSGFSLFVFDVWSEQWRKRDMKRMIGRCFPIENWRWKFSFYF